MLNLVKPCKETDADSLAPNTAAAYVDEWKDQSGNANHATQGTPSNQPQIHSGLASTDLILENGKPAIASTISTSLTMSSTISVRSLFSTRVVRRLGAASGIGASPTMIGSL